jgi:hypothetical protein
MILVRKEVRQSHPQIITHLDEGAEVRGDDHMGRRDHRGIGDRSEQRESYRTCLGQGLGMRLG